MVVDRPPRARAVSVLIAVALAASPFAAHAADPPNRQRVGPFEIAVEFVPPANARLAEPDRGAATHKEAMRRGEYHLVVTLRDVRSGQLVEGARIEAEVRPSGMDAQSKILDRMVVDDTPAYGNYFAIPAHGPYTVHLWIAHGRHVEATFAFDRE
jgi:hypothetical protein